MTQEYTPVDWVDETENQVGTVINKARLDQMQTAHHFADGFKEVDTVPTADPGVDYHMVVFCTADTTFYRWNGIQWVKDVDDSTLALLEAHEADHNNPHVVTKAQVGLGNVDNKGTVSSWQTTPDNDHIPTEKLVKDSLDAKVDDSQIVTAFQGTPDNTHIASEKLTKDSLDAKLDDSQLVTLWSGTVSDTNIPSEKLVKDSLDGKVDKLATKPTAGTYTKLTINAEGQVTEGSSLLASDIPSLDWSKITSGKPTTLAGYGITDAVNTTGDQTGIAGAKTWTGIQTFQNTLEIGGTKPTLDTHYNNMTWDYTSRIIEDGPNRLHLIKKNATNPATPDGELTINSYGLDSWLTCTSRAYNSANVNDIVTIGSLASNPNVVHTTGNERINGVKWFDITALDIVANVEIGTESDQQILALVNPALNTIISSIYVHYNTNRTTQLYTAVRNSDGSFKRVLLASGDVI